MRSHLATFIKTRMRSAFSKLIIWQIKNKKELTNVIQNLKMITFNNYLMSENLKLIKILGTYIYIYKYIN